MEDMILVLRTMRPDLPASYIPIRLMDTRFLCLFVSEQGTLVEDSPLFEITMDGIDAPKEVHPSFKR
jgi:hypothetical protein